MCLGFLLTTISIELIPKVESHVGWRYAFMILAPGPIFGVIQCCVCVVARGGEDRAWEEIEQSLICVSVLSAPQC